MGAKHFFFYGTLLDRGVRRAVIGPPADRLEALPAELHGWRRVRVRGKRYPVIVPAPGSVVDGCLFGPLPASAVARLIRFEGPEYRLTEVEVLTGFGVPTAARTFIGGVRIRPTMADWRFDDWRRKSRSVYLCGLDSRGSRSR